MHYRERRKNGISRDHHTITRSGDVFPVDDGEDQCVAIRTGEGLFNNLIETVSNCYLKGFTVKSMAFYHFNTALVELSLPDVELIGKKAFFVQINRDIKF